MKVDYFSDPHFDFYLQAKKLDSKAVLSFLRTLFKYKESDILIIAGDFGHHNEQIVFIMKIIKEHFYKHIICVLGNHDYYMVSDEIRDRYNSNSLNRAQELKGELNNINGIHCLDGDVIEVEGIKFGGCDSWYDGSYAKRLFKDRVFSESSINEMWRNSLNDYRYIYSVEKYNDIFKIELPKIKRVYKNCDVMITHVNPSSQVKHAQKCYARDETTAFFAFDGEKYIANGSMRYWVYGHTHGKNEYELADVKVICNPMGYPNENLHFRIESFNV